MRTVRKDPRALEILKFLAKGGMSLEFRCKKGRCIEQDGRCQCKCDNSKMKQARKVKINKLKEYGLLFTKNYKVASCAAAKQ